MILPLTLKRTFELLIRFVMNFISLEQVGLASNPEVSVRRGEEMQGVCF
jgi:hypothetical protein